MTHHYKLAAAALTLLSLTSLVGADQVSTPLNVTASLRGNCLVEAQSLDFPEYTPGAGDVHSESTIAVRCSKGTAYSVTLDEGVHGTSAEARRMTNGAESLAYQLYLDAARTTVWGDGVNGSAVSGEGEGMAQPILNKVYGRLPDTDENRDSPEGEYSDVITVTVTF